MFAHRESKGRFDGYRFFLRFDSSTISALNTDSIFLPEGNARQESVDWDGNLGGELAEGKVKHKVSSPVC